MSNEHDMSRMWTQEFWDARYAESDGIWSRNPNPRLVQHASDLATGEALDVGCGEGTDAIWLAARGWNVTGLDLSQVALDRAAARAADLSPAVSGRLTWLRADLLTGDPLPTDFDLVSVQFMHVPRELFDGLYRRLAATVRPGGSLLVVGHHPDDLASGARHHDVPDILFPPEQVTAVLDPAEWDVKLADALVRTMERDGEQVSVRDTVVHAARRA
ncbi:methyltransferase domain-containing protein [Nocardioides sp.]|jgi:SAM-dependent methyltransferase|uniref:class I SAM-dependent methyltransferase n=1 Tax=Nocardioides sp. TaxID=35761 RepID=UPI0031FE6C13|nr:tehB [Nocardioides sp.]